MIIRLILPDFTWVSFGGERRGADPFTDQWDNGIVFHTSGGHEQEQDKQVLLAFAKEVNKRLDECGLPGARKHYGQQPGAVLNAGQWRLRFDRIIQTTTPENLLQSTILFDIRAVWGDEQVIDELKRHVSVKVANNTLFQKMMAANALANRPAQPVQRLYHPKKGPEKQRHWISKSRVESLHRGNSNPGAIKRVDDHQHPGPPDKTG